MLMKNVARRLNLNLPNEIINFFIIYEIINRHPLLQRTSHHYGACYGGKKFAL